MQSKPQPDIETREGTCALTAWLPAGWKEKMHELGAFNRARQIRSETNLLRLIFAYVIFRKSLPELALWSKDKEIADLKFPSLWERFARSMRFMGWLLEELLIEFASEPPEDWMFVPIDATTFSLPGSQGRDWLVHAAWADGGFRHLDVTKAKGAGHGESLRRFESLPDNAVALADRAYGTPPQLGRWDKWKKKYVIRFTWNNLPIYIDREGKEKVDPIKWLTSLLPGHTREMWAWVRPKGMEPFRVRVAAVRLDPAKAEQNRRKARAMSTRKGHTPRKETLFLAEFVTLVSNLKEEELDAEGLFSAYRWRWQIELAFKRFKSSSLIRRLVNQKDEMVRFYLYTAFSLWLLAERMARERAFFPWGYPLVSGGEARVGRSGQTDEIRLAVAWGGDRG